MIAYFTIFAEGRALLKDKELTTAGTIFMFLAFLAWLTYIGPKVSLLIKNKVNPENEEESTAKIAALTGIITTTNNDYEILGVTSACSVAEIKKAFREKCRLLHPDNNPSGDSQAFQKLANAYEALIEKQERKNSLSRNKV